MNKTTVPFLSPGCFGSALLFHKEGMVCAACPFANNCEPVHEESLQAMRDLLGIKAPVVIKRATKSSTDTEEVFESEERLALPKKVRELLRRLDRENINIVEKIKEGVNPFIGNDRYRYLQITCHLILKLKSPVTQKLIATGLIKSMGWAEGTADAHARMAVQALTHVGAIKNDNDILSVRHN